MKLTECYDGTLFECRMIINLLENEGIPSFLKDEIVGTRGAGWKPGGSVKVMVPDMDFTKARLIVEAYEKSRQTD